MTLPDSGLGRHQVLSSEVMDATRNTYDNLHMKVWFDTLIVYWHVRRKLGSLLHGTIRHDVTVLLVDEYFRMACTVGMTMLCNPI